MSAAGRPEPADAKAGGATTSGSSVVALGCFGGSRALERPQLPRRRSSFGWFGRAPPTDAEGPAAADAAPDSEAAVAEALAALQLGEQPADAAGKPGPSKPAPLSAHRRRWSFGRQVAPQPAPDADSDGSPVANEAAAAAAAVQDDLLVAASESSISSITRSSPERAQQAASARPARQQQGAAPPATPEQRQQSGGAPAAGATTPQKGQGYRRLWHSITSVRKGDPYPAGGGSSGAEVTVESLVKAVQVRGGKGLVCVKLCATRQLCVSVLGGMGDQRSAAARLHSHRHAAWVSWAPFANLCSAVPPATRSPLRTTPRFAPPCSGSSRGSPSSMPCARAFTAWTPGQWQPC
jgi:hypothetical protein